MHVETMLLMFTVFWILNLVLRYEFAKEILLFDLLILDRLSVCESCFDVDLLLLLLVNVSDEILELVDLVVGHGSEVSQSGHSIKIIIRFSVRIWQVIMRHAVFLIIPPCVFDDRRRFKFLSDPV